MSVPVSRCPRSRRIFYRALLVWFGLGWVGGVRNQQVLTNKRGEKARRHWIVFDGDVDPDWAENLNSVLDDNKILTLPSGERLEVPDNVRIMLEVTRRCFVWIHMCPKSGFIRTINEIIRVPQDHFLFCDGVCLLTWFCFPLTVGCRYGC